MPKKPLHAEDVFTSALDGCLNDIERRIEPFLNRSNSGEIAREVEQHIQTHLGTELFYIATGTGTETEECTSPSVLYLRKKRLARLKRKTRARRS